jgi:hypothetical protein
MAHPTMCMYTSPSFDGAFLTTFHIQFERYLQAELRLEETLDRPRSTPRAAAM